MRTEAGDYLYSAALIGMVVAATASALWVAEPWLRAALGSYAAIGMLLLFAFGYGGFTALLLAVVSSWLPLREGDYPTDDPQFRRWKVQHVVAELGKAALSLLFPVFARASFYVVFGARVGRRVAIAGKIIDPRLTVLEDDCVLGEGCILTSHAIVKNRFVLRAVRVGKGATIGVGSILMPGVSIGAGAIVLPGSVLKAGTEVPSGETWGGVPAVRISPAGA